MIKNFTHTATEGSENRAFCLVLSTCGSEKEALKLAETLVAERLCACVNIVPGLQSIYRWGGQVERSGEHLLLIKTSSELLSVLETRMAELHSYDTPEIIAVPINAGSEKYLRWLAASL